MHVTLYHLHVHVVRIIVLYIQCPRQLIFLGKVTALGVLCCFALFVCLTLLASFFLPSHLSFKSMYIYIYIHVYVLHVHVHVCVSVRVLGQAPPVCKWSGCDKLLAGHLCLGHAQCSDTSYPHSHLVCLLPSGRIYWLCPRSNISHLGNA